MVDLPHCLASARYVYGEAKQNILDTVPFASPDIKARYFIRKCALDPAPLVGRYCQGRNQRLEHTFMSRLMKSTHLDLHCTSRHARAHTHIPDSIELELLHSQSLVSKQLVDRESQKTGAGRQLRSEVVHI